VGGGSSAWAIEAFVNPEVCHISDCCLSDPVNDISQVRRQKIGPELVRQGVVVLGPGHSMCDE